MVEFKVIGGRNGMVVNEAKESLVRQDFLLLCLADLPLTRQD
jgi:hypothetical protein